MTFTRNGKKLVRNGKAATSVDCCCCCCPEEGDTCPDYRFRCDVNVMGTLGNLTIDMGTVSRGLDGNWTWSQVTCLNPSPTTVVMIPSDNEGGQTVCGACPGETTGKPNRRYRLNIQGCGVEDPGFNIKYVCNPQSVSPVNGEWYCCDVDEIWSTLSPVTKCGFTDGGACGIGDLAYIGVKIYLLGL